MKTIETKTQCGGLRGRLEDGLCVFRGIPYAAPPTGERRWHPSEPPDAWVGTRDAFEFGAAAMQTIMSAAPGDPLSAVMQLDEPMSEDCLYLNLWTRSLEGSRPVMVWIHGGGFDLGAGSQPVYDGQHLAQREVVVITINYRLGPFGVCHLDAPTGGAIPATGNESLLDQVAALRWVRENVAAFGGDPDNVTIFGESAGSASVACLLAMPSAQRLFHKAIAQSGGGCHFEIPIEDSVSSYTEPMLERLGTRDPEALMKLPAEAILEAFPGFLECMRDPARMGRYPGQVADGEVLPGSPEDALAAGAAAGIPILAGNTRDEMSQVGDIAMDLDDAQLAELLRDRLPAPLVPEQIIGVYRAAREARGVRADAASILSAIATNKVEIVPSTRLLDAQRAHAPVFNYLFDWMSPAAEGRYGAHHGLDIAFPFGTHTRFGTTFGRGPAADALANAMMDAWTAFARTGNPSSQGLGDWPEYDAERRPTMMIGPNVHVADDPMGAERRAFDGVASSAPEMKTIP